MEITAQPMIELATVKVGASIAAVGGLVGAMAVIDPSVTSIALAVIAAAVVIIPLWFKFRTDAMTLRMKEQDAKIEHVITTTNGMKTELVVAKEDAGRAKGVLEGVAQAEFKAEAAATDVLTKAATAAAAVLTTAATAAAAAGEAKADAKKPA